MTVNVNDYRWSDHDRTITITTVKIYGTSK